MSFGDEPPDWRQGCCEPCAKNAHECVKMVFEQIDENSPPVFVCPQCGSTKRF